MHANFVAPALLGVILVPILVPFFSWLYDHGMFFLFFGSLFLSAFIMSR